MLVNFIIISCLTIAIVFAQEGQRRERAKPLPPWEEWRREQLKKIEEQKKEEEKPSESEKVVTPPVSPQGAAPLKPQPSEEPKPAKKTSAGEDETVSLFFDDADIYEVAHTVFGEILKVNYMIDPKVTGRITFRSVRPVKKADLLPVVSILFRLNGISIIEEAGIYRIIPLTDISKEPAGIGFGSSSKDLQIKGLSIIQIVPLNFVSSKEMKTILEPFLTKGATIAEVPGKNYLIISDTDENMKRLIQIVEIFDDKVFEDVKVKMFVFKNFKVSDVMDSLRGALPLFPTDEKGMLKVRVLSIEKLNALLVVAPSEDYLKHVEKWVEIVDTLFEGASPKIYVYPLQNSKAEHVSEILQQILFGGGKTTSTPKTTTKTTTQTKGASQPAQQPAPQQAISVSPLEESLVTPGTKIFPDEITNSLIILTTPSDYPLIEEAIKKIDVVPRQVLIEALVAEVTLTDNLKFGIEWFLNSHFSLDKTKLTGFTAVGSDKLSYDITKPLSTPGFTFAAVDSADVVRGLLQTLAGESKVKVLASPHILASDNREAKIQVGKQVPVQTSTSVTSGGETVTSIQYRDTGVVLTVKPQINEGGLVSLEVKQEVSSVDPEAGVGGNPIISNRTAETTIVVQDNQTIIIGGLIQENKSTVREGIPLLKDIPLLGLLFGYTSVSDDRTELVVTLTPRVIRSIDESRLVTEEFKKKLKGLKDTLPTGKD
ncbi:MAG: type II secretion system secretin GspD [Thermodesulfovibrionia bacterium]